MSNFLDIGREDALTMVGKGWSDIINELYNKKPEDVKVIQVKEKYGTLRFYVLVAPEWYFNFIDEMENKSSKVCEKCGKPGMIRTDRGWILTLCDECNKMGVL
jgi:hypothetical protein